MTAPSPTGRRRSRRPRIGIALAGGGPEGAVYEIGAIRALEEALEGVDFNAADVYVGVSAGAFIASSLANQLTPTQMVRALVKHEPGEHPFVPETFLTPAYREWAARGLMLPKLIADAFLTFARQPHEHSLFETLTRVGRALPVGFFDNEPIRRYLEHTFALKGRTDDFRELRRKLVVVASDLGSGTAIRFGEPPWDHVPISRAVQASTALPGVYPPVEIDGRYCVDGVLLRTVHASVALEAGADLLLCVNPIVPVDIQQAVESGTLRNGLFVERGLPTVLSQTFRTLIHSRLQVGMAAYEKRFPGSDVVLFEPDRDDYQMLFGNIFTFATRRTVCERAYAQTRRDLWRRRKVLAPILARHGVRLRLEVLEDPDRNLWEGVGLMRDGSPSGATDDLGRALAHLESAINAARLRDRRSRRPA